MNKKAVRELAFEWLNNPATEIYGKQLMWAISEPETLWKIFEKEDQMWRCGNENQFTVNIQENDEH